MAGRRSVRWRAERCTARQEKHGPDGCQHHRLVIVSGWVFWLRPDGSNAQHLRHEREVKFWHVRRQLGHLPLPPRRIDERARVSAPLLLVPLHMAAALALAPLDDIASVIDKMRVRLNRTQSKSAGFEGGGMTKNGGGRIWAHDRENSVVDPLGERSSQTVAASRCH